MPWEMIGDFVRTADMPPEDARWAGITVGLVSAMSESEPKLRMRIRNLPPKGKPPVYRPLTASEVGPKLQHRREIPDAKTVWVRQYQCKTCGSPEKAQWVPQMYLSLHEGHDITKGPPTGKSKEFSWEPNYRLFFGAAQRLNGMIGTMYSIAVTSPTSEPHLLRGFDQIWLIGPANEKEIANIHAVSGCESVVALPLSPQEAVSQMLELMKQIDVHALEGTNIEDAEARLQKLIKRVEGARKRLNEKKEQQKTEKPVT